MLLFPEYTLYVYKCKLSLYGGTITRVWTIYLPWWQSSGRWQNTGSWIRSQTRKKMIDSGLPKQIIRTTKRRWVNNPHARKDLVHRDSSVSKVLAVQGWGPEFKPREARESQAQKHASVTPMFLWGDGLGTRGQVSHHALVSSLLPWQNMLTKSNFEEKGLTVAHTSRFQSRVELACTQPTSHSCPSQATLLREWCCPHWAGFLTSVH